MSDAVAAPAPVVDGAPADAAPDATTTPAVAAAAGPKQALSKDAITGKFVKGPTPGSAQADRLIKERGEEKAKAEPAAAEAKAEAAKRKYKLKVDGREFEEELGDDEITVRLQKSHAAEKRMQEAATERQRIQKILALGKNDPNAAFKELFGIDAEAHYQERLAQKYRAELELAQMKPEDRVAKEWEAKLNEAKAEATKYRQEIESKQQSELDAKVYAEVTANFETALTSEGMPKSFEMLSEMAKVAKLANANGFDLSPQQLAQEVRARVEARQEKLRQSVTTGLKGEDLVKHLGEDVAKEVIRAYLARTKAASPPPPPAAPVKRAPPAPATEKQSMSSARFIKKFVHGIG